MSSKSFQQALNATQNKTILVTHHSFSTQYKSILTNCISITNLSTTNVQNTLSLNTFVHYKKVSLLLMLKTCLKTTFITRIQNFIHSYAILYIKTNYLKIQSHKVKMFTTDLIFEQKYSVYA